ncbi:MAG: hypothetical protein Q4G26_08165 [Paracoccus sp. (in: a-proteobacteria)]|nr:hypothetical protein [Paracoccus sp. (in: a-proteobacteria)]
MAPNPMIPFRTRPSPEQVSAMRDDGTIPQVKPREIPVLIASYRDILPVWPRSSPIFQPHEFAYFFGFDENGPLPEPFGSDALTSASIKARRKLLTQINAYTSMPGQRDKAARFLPFTPEAPRLLAVLRHGGYGASQYYRPGDMPWHLSFWGVVMILLQSPETRTALLDDMIGGGAPMPARDDYIALLDKAVHTILPDVPADEAGFHAHAARLARIRHDRWQAGEVSAFCADLGLDAGPDDDWLIHVMIRNASGEQMNLAIRPHPDFPWDVHILGDGGQYGERAGGVSQNDRALPPVGRLANLPAWLAAQGGWDLAGAHYGTGRRRNWIAPLRRWLTGGA